jgi:CelD/BcsL family acetyltransferase involved in cellulose biosynthesis
MDDLKVRVIEDDAGLQALAGTWDDLVDAMENPPPFFTHAWVTHWWANFRNGRTLHIVTVWSGEELIGILPLQKTICTVLKIFRLRSFQSFVNGHCLLSDIISRPDDFNRVWREIAGHFSGMSAAWDLLMLAYIPLKKVDSICAGLQGTGYKVFVEPAGRSFESYYLDIKGGFKEYFDGLNRSFRDNRKNINNRLRRKGTVEFEVKKTFDADAISQFITLEDSGWKGRAGTSIKVSNEVKSFYMRIAETFAEKGQFLLATLRVDGKTIASVYGLLFKNIFYFLRIGIQATDPEINKLSPGQAILYHLIAYCYDEKLSCFDFVGACYYYESHWTKTVNRKKTVMIFNGKRFPVKLCVILKRLLALRKGAGEGSHD